MLSKPVGESPVSLPRQEPLLFRKSRPTTSIYSRPCKSENATAPGSQSMSPRSYVPSNELWLTALVMIDAASAALGWGMIKG